MCSMSNEVPQLFDWDQIRNQPGDRWARDELNHSVVEFVAPTEYMVRPPQPAVYVILIDVSHTAVQSGKPSRLVKYHLCYIFLQAWWQRRHVLSLRTLIAYLTRTSAPKSPSSLTTFPSISSLCQLVLFDPLRSRANELLL